MTAKERFKNDFGLSGSCIVITPQLNFIMEKGVDRRRENLSTVNEIVLLIFEEDGQAPGRDLVLILRADRPVAD